MALNVKPDAWFAAAIAKAMVDERTDRIDPGWHHPSSLHKVCVAEKQFSFIGAPREDKPNYMLAYTAMVGTAVHQYFQGVLTEDHPRVEAIELSVLNEELRLKGHADYIVIDPDGVRCVLDMKTIENLPTSPREKDIVQVLWYMHVLEVERGAIVYIRRSTGNMARFTFERGPFQEWGEWKKSFADVQTITEMTKAEEFAPRTPEDNKQKYCKEKCSFFRQCEKVVSGDKSEWLPLVKNTIQILSQPPSQQTSGKTNSDETESPTSSPST